MPNADVGVIVGRFQVHRLHDAHRQIIDSIYTTHTKTIIVLGLSPVKVTIENPLDFEARRQMLLESYPKATILYIKDHPNDTEWSKQLDRLVGDVVSPAQSVKLYGGRDSFIRVYTGRYPTTELEQTVYVSGKETRKSISKHVKGTEDFRAGVIWASANQYPRVFPTVDVAIFNDTTYEKLLLVRKPDEDLWRFPGGFVDPRDANLEAAARREAQEETNLEVGGLSYVVSAQVQDWRYRRESDKIMTTLFSAINMFGSLTPADDVAFAQWFDFKTLQGAPYQLVPEHRDLFLALVKWRSTRVL
jgi:bifunctional NMN adenylyltransferase/nudix hydrolase